MPILSCNLNGHGQYQRNTKVADISQMRSSRDFFPRLEMREQGLSHSGSGINSSVSPGTTSNQSTLGAFVGKIASKNGHGTMVDFKYVDGASALPSNAEVKKLRSASD